MVKVHAFRNFFIKKIFFRVTTSVTPIWYDWYTLTIRRSEDQWDALHAEVKKTYNQRHL